MKVHFGLMVGIALTACGRGGGQSADGSSAKPADVATTSTAPDAASEPPPAGELTEPVEVTTVEGITEYELGNGLRVLLFPDPSKTTVTVNATYMVGSRHESYGETGMAHLLEHMLFKGTPKHEDIWGEMKERGARFNGTTDYDRTNYYETVTATEDNLLWALDLEADRMVNSKISPEDLASEFSVVRNEFETHENNPSAVLFERMLSTAYLWHAYGKSPIGSRSDIERVPVENLRAFYEKYYQPDNAVLVVAGKIDPEKTLAQINERFGAIPRPERKLETTYTVEPVQDGEREVVLRRKGDTQLVGLAYHIVAGADEDYAASEALAHLLTNEPSGRLYRALVETKLASRVWAQIYPMAEPGFALFFAEVPSEAPLEPVEAAMIAEIEGFADPARAPSEPEIERFKNEKAKDFTLLMNDSQRAAIYLSEWQAQGDWRLLFVHRDRIAALDTERVKGFAERYLKRANRTLGRFVPTDAPDRSPVPGRPDVVALTKDYKGQEAVDSGEAFEATVDNIEAKTIRSTVGGMKLALLPKATRGGAIRGNMVLRFGTTESLWGRGLAGELVPMMLMRGTTEHSYQELKDELARLKSEVEIEGSGLFPQPGVIWVRIDTTRENLEAVLKLLGEVLRKPKFAEEQFEILKNELLTKLTSQLSNPQSLLLTRGIRKLMPVADKDDPRYTPTIEEAIEDVKALELAEVKRFHADFYGATNAEAAFVGDFDPKELEGILERELGGWKAPQPFERVPNLYLSSKGGDDIIDTPDKEGGFIATVQSFQMKDDDALYPAVVLYNYILGGAGASRLNNRLRQKEGWSYGAFSKLHVSSLDEFGIFLAFALVNPQNAPKALAAMREEITRLLDEGVEPEELAESKKAWANAFDTSLADDRKLAGKLLHGLYLGRTLEWEQQLNEKIAALTPADIAKLKESGPLKPASFGTVLAADQKKAKEQ